VFAVECPNQELLDTLDQKALGRLACVYKESSEWVKAYLVIEHRAGYTMRPADIRSGLQVGMLHHFARIAGACVVLPAAVYSRRRCTQRLLTIAWYQPTWRAGYGPLQIAAGVTLVGQEGVVLSGEHRRLKVESEGVSFVSLHLPLGVRIHSGGSLTMTKCTSTGEMIYVDAGASLAMEDSRVFGCKTGNHGVAVMGGKLVLRGGTVSENKGFGVFACSGAVVTVAKAEEGKPQTVSKDNEGHDWGAYGALIIGIPQEKINA